MHQESRNIPMVELVESHSSNDTSGLYHTTPVVTWYDLSDLVCILKAQGKRAAVTTPVFPGLHILAGHHAAHLRMQGIRLGSRQTI